MDTDVGKAGGPLPAIFRAVMFVRSERRAWSDAPCLRQHLESVFICIHPW
jgi:hypothetical protein